MFPSYVPPHAGTYGAPTIDPKGRAARGNLGVKTRLQRGRKPLRCIDKPPRRGLMFVIDGCSFRANRERGKDGVLIRGCPRNCKRIAQRTVSSPILGAQTNATGMEPGKAALGETAEPGDLPSI